MGSTFKRLIERCVGSGFRWASEGQNQRYCNNQSTKRSTSSKANENSEFKEANCSSAGRARCAAAMVLILHLIGWEYDASFLNQSQNEVKPSQNNPLNSNYCLNIHSYIHANITSTDYQVDIHNIRRKISSSRATSMGLRLVPFSK